MSSIISKQKKPDEVRQAEWQESAEAPELLVGYLAKIGRGRLLSAQEEASLHDRGCPHPEDIKVAGEGGIG